MPTSRTPNWVVAAIDREEDFCDVLDVLRCFISIALSSSLHCENQWVINVGIKRVDEIKLYWLIPTVSGLDIKLL